MENFVMAAIHSQPCSNVDYVFTPYENSLDKVERTAYHPGSRGIVSQWYKRPWSCYEFPPKRGLL